MAARIIVRFELMRGVWFMVTSYLWQNSVQM